MPKKIKMNCYNHNNTGAIVQCPDCSRGLCSACSSKYSIVICTSCNDLRFENEKRNIKKELIILLTAGVLFSLMMGVFLYTNNNINNNKGQVFLTLIFGVSYSSMSFVFGFILLGQYGGNFLNSMPPLFKLLLGLPMLYLAAVIGGVLLPFRLYKNMKRLREIG